MSNVKKEIMKQKIKDSESDYLKFIYKTCENANLFFYDMLNDFSVSIFIPCLSILIQYLHIFFFPFKEIVSYFL